MAKKRILIWALTVFAVAALLGSGFLFGWKAGRKFPETIIVEGIGNLEDGKPQGVDFGTFWQAWGEIDQIYLNNSDVDASDRLQGAIRGLIGALGDPYSEFFRPDDNQKFQEDIQGSFGGIGAELGIRDDQLLVIAPLKDSPASRAGLQPSDKIIAINSSSTFGISIDAAVKTIRGPIAEPVTLTIFREGWDKTRDFTIIREVITIPTIEVDMLEGNIAHVKLFSFNANAASLFYGEMFNALTGGAKGMILDLRNNPGGFLEVAVDLAGWFVPRGSLVLTQEGRGNMKQEFRAVGNAAFEKFPLVILLNKGSASASEILAGAIKVNRDDVKIVGEQSFGKGTVQELRDLRDGSSLKLTVAHWVLPNGVVLEGRGLEPDIKIERTEDDFENDRDPQLEKAIEVLKAEINR